MGFYGEPDTARRHEAGDKLRALNSQQEKPWLCFGDFNEIIKQDEKLGVLGGLIIKCSSLGR